MNALTLPMAMPIYPEDLPQVESVVVRPVVGEILSELMQKYNLKISDLERILGIPRSTLWQWMTGEVVPSNSNHQFFMLCKFFRVSYEYMLWGIGDENFEIKTVAEIKAIDLLKNVFEACKKSIPERQRFSVEIFLKNYEMDQKQMAAITGAQ